jgi:hypothetical protein
VLLPWVVPAAVAAGIAALVVRRVRMRRLATLPAGSTPAATE